MWVLSAPLRIQLGNRALQNNMKHNIPVRLIRNQQQRNFVYDGLYAVVACDYEPVGNFMQYKFTLQRLPNQPALSTASVQAKYGTKALPEGFK